MLDSNIVLRRIELDEELNEENALICVGALEQELDSKRVFIGIGGNLDFGQETDEVIPITKAEMNTAILSELLN